MPDIKITDFVEFNPQRVVKKGTIAPFVDMAALSVDSRDIAQIGEREFKGSGSKFVNGDTLFARITPCLENGKTAKVLGLPEGVVASGSTEFIVLSAIEPEYDEDYVYYLARLPEFRTYARARMEGTSGRQRVPWQSLVDFEFNFPQKEKRKKIGAFLKKVDDKIELNRQTNKTLEQIAQAIFKSWFVEFEPTRAKVAAKQTGQDIERAAMAVISGKTLDELDQLCMEEQKQIECTAALFPDALVDSELGEIPEGWEVKKLKEICKVLNGRAYKNTEFKEEGTPIVRIQNLSNGGNGGKTVYSDLDLPLEKLIHKEDFIYAWSATFGPHIWRGSKSIYHYHIWKMDVDEDVISRYFLYLSMFRKTEQMKSGATGSIFTHLTKSIMESQEILIATPALNLFFKDTLDNYFKKISALNEEINALEDFKSAILPSLLAGNMEVLADAG